MKFRLRAPPGEFHRVGNQIDQHQSQQFPARPTRPAAAGFSTRCCGLLFPTEKRRASPAPTGQVIRWFFAVLRGQRANPLADRQSNRPSAPPTWNSSPQTGGSFPAASARGALLQQLHKAHDVAQRCAQYCARRNNSPLQLRARPTAIARCASTTRCSISMSSCGTFPFAFVRAEMSSEKIMIPPIAPFLSCHGRTSQRIQSIVPSVFEKASLAATCKLHYKKQMH